MSANRKQGADLFSRLPHQLLVNVLRFVTLKRRLTLCALVHSSWRAAATEATTKLILMRDRINSGSLSAWLQSNSSRLTEVSITRVAGPGISACSSMDLLQLPLNNFKDLQQLRLMSVAWRPAKSTGKQPLQRRRGQPPRALPSLANLTALTSLDLCGASVLLDGLAALTQLQHLGLSEVRPGPHLKAVPAAGLGIPKVEIAAAVLAAALPHLQHLKSLNLQSDICSTAVLVQISTLQHLEQLSLHPSAPTSLPLLPQSLTGLSATRLRVGSAADLTRLTGLRELSLKESNLDSADRHESVARDHLMISFAEQPTQAAAGAQHAYSALIMTPRLGDWCRWLAGSGRGSCTMVAPHPAT